MLGSADFPSACGRAFHLGWLPLRGLGHQAPRGSRSPISSFSCAATQRCWRPFKSGFRSKSNSFSARRRRRRFRTEDYFYYYRHLKHAFLEQQHKFSPEEPPDIPGLKNLGRLVGARRKDPRRARRPEPGSPTYAPRKFVGCGEGGIDTVRSLSETEVRRIAPRCAPRRLLDSVGRLASRFNPEAWPGRSMNSWSLIRSGRGSAWPACLRSRPYDIFFDMEGYPLLENGLEYLFGATYLDNGQPAYIDWWGPQQRTGEGRLREFR